MTGIYFRVEREGKYKSVEIEELTEEERKSFLKDFEKDALIKTIDLLCQNNQDKISFAVEKLKQVREIVRVCPITDYDINEQFHKMYKRDAIARIDEQIKQLKERK